MIFPQVGGDDTGIQAQKHQLAVGIDGVNLNNALS